jgi:hypothetical protein
LRGISAAVLLALALLESLDVGVREAPEDGRVPAILQFSGAPALESAVTFPEPGALTERIAALMARAA